MQHTSIKATGDNLLELEHYLKKQFQSVKGWCSPHLWQAIQPLHELQNSLGVRAPIAETGVFYGKLFIGLLKTKN